MKGYKALKKGMKKSKKKTIYITVLRYIYRGTLFWSIFGAFRAIGVYDVTNQNFGLTMLKVLFCCSIMGLSVWGLITIDGYFARRIDRMDDEKEKNIDLETKIAILEGDVRTNKLKKDELIKTNNELRNKVEELRAERDTMMQSLGALNDAYKEKDKALAKADRTIERAQKWVSAQKRMCER